MWLNANFATFKLESINGYTCGWPLFNMPTVRASKCGAALADFANKTADPVAVYDLNGVHKVDGQVGGGYDVCLCFALKQRIANLRYVFCLWSDARAYGEDVYVSARRSNSYGTLDQL